MELKAQQVSFAYKHEQPVLEDISVELRSGEILYLLGHNGSGKTTLLSCLSGILMPTRGCVLLDGIDIHKIPAQKRAQSIGLIPQLHVSAFAYTVRQMVLMGRAPHLGWFGAPRRVDHEIADAALDRVGLADFRERAYTELSGGERQLVMIARGLAQQCDFLLMDEPDAHLDPSNQHRILEIVADLVKQKLSFVIASHAPNSALMFADRVALLSKGRVLAQGSVQDTLTEELLTRAYGMATEVIYKSHNGRRSPRAILPRRNTIPVDVEVIAVKPSALSTLGSPLETIFSGGRDKPQIVLVTGESGSGKSSWCSDLVMEMQRRGWKVGGILSPAVVKSGSKTGIDLVDLSSGQRRRLATLRDTSSSDVMTDLWAFDLEVLQWGNALLENLPTETDLLVIDELGPLEFKRGKGLSSAFGSVDRRRYKVACVIVRPGLLHEALRRWSDAYVIDVEDE